MAVNTEAADHYSTTSRRTTSDEVFDEIYSQICTMKLLPGVKLSEVEIARQFDVSRQPVREAFIRLGNMGLLLIRPQRATTVKKISLKDVASARFIRLAIELEVLSQACKNFERSHEVMIRENLDEQLKAIDSEDIIKFGQLDLQFHMLFCTIADIPKVFETITEQKKKIDRLCSLSLANLKECQEVYADHEQLLQHLINRDETKLLACLRSHLSRLDSTIVEISKTHAHYFE